MQQTELDISTVAALDDVVLPFAVDGLDIRGRAVRLGPALDSILRRHAYPEAVSAVIGQAVALTALLGTSLKFDGRFILQTQSDGPIDMLIVDFRTPDRLRAYARFDADAVAAAVAAGDAGTQALLGHGHLAMTVDQGSEMSRYQGIVPLDGASLEDVAHTYFRQSEQIPTRVRLAVAQAFTRSEGGTQAMWRAGGILIQHLPEGGLGRAPDLPPGDAPEGHEEAGAEEADDIWRQASMLLSTVEDHELIEPSLASERLLFRLFHERGVRVFERRELQEVCHCSRTRITGLIRQFTPQERADMVEDGRIKVTCEFCSTSYAFDPADFVEGA